MLALLLLIVPPAFPSAPTTLPARIQPLVLDDEVPDKRPEVKALLDKLLSHTKKLGDEDGAAIGIIERLATEFKRSGPADKKSIVTAVTRAMRVRRKVARDGSRKRQMFLVAARVLGGMAPESVSSLIRLAGEKNHKQDYAVRGAILAALGKTKDEKAVKVLTKELDEFQARVQAAAAEALGQFTHLDHWKRKAIFKDLLKLLMNTQAAHQSDPSGMTTSDRWRRVQSPCRRSMAKLSGVGDRSPNSWRDWWNDNKKENWDKKDKKG